MAYSRQELEALLKFVVDLCNKEENQWFKEELLQALGAEGNTGSNTFVAFGEKLTNRVDDIERYLSLDYKLDTAPSIISYDNIKDEGYRVKLRQDNREMLRYRYGTRGHVIDFLEFCKFAHLQAEALLNYFYGHKRTTIEEILVYIEKYLEPLNFNISSRNQKQKVTDITFNDKKNAFCQEFNPGSQKYPLTFQFNETLELIRQARNEISHRSGQKDDNTWKEYYRETIKKSGLPIKDKDLDTRKIHYNPDWTQTYKEHFKSDITYKEYHLYVWLGKRPFDQVINALSKMAEIIQLQIQ